MAANPDFHSPVERPPGRRASAAAAAVLAGLLLCAALPGAAAEGAATFPTPDAAVQALRAAAAARSRAALNRLFGPAAGSLLSGDPIEDANELDRFAAYLQQKAGLVREGSARASLRVGNKQWPFPIPLVKQQGRWHFDTVAGRSEILTRRVGENELFAIQVCRELAKAQQEYAAADPNGTGSKHYAGKLISSPGKKDGLYWPVSGEEQPSPLGPLVAQARAEGYGGKRKAGVTGPRPFHGYLFRLLTEQGLHAPGGRQSYLTGGSLTRGFAFVAVPAAWGRSGVMTFLVGPDGAVHQKDLGPQTTARGAELKDYDPDASWTPVAP